jgi:hypothetical protein
MQEPEEGPGLSPAVVTALAIVLLLAVYLLYHFLAG